MNVRHGLDWGSAGCVWPSISSVVYNKCMPLRPKAQMYRIMHPAILYGAEAWVVKRQQVQCLQVFGMRHLCSIKRVTQRDRFQKERIK